MMSSADKYHHHLHLLPPPQQPTTPTKLMTGAEEHRHFLRVFIQTYRDLPVLWDTSLRDYTNREKRADAYDQLVPIYRYLKRDATVDDVKKKINTLRTNYRKELKVVECARRSGSVHTPRCWTFHELDFLRNTEKFLAVNPNSRSSSAHHESSFASFNEQTNSSFMDAHTPSTTPNAYTSFRSMMAQNSTVQSPPPSITEMFQKSFGGGHTQKLEPQQTPPPATQSSSLSGSVGYSASVSHEVKRQRLSSPSASNTATQVQTSASNAGGATNSEELLNIACDYLSGTFPEEESIARTWTHKLKRMQRDQRLLAEKFINEILFEGESATLHRGSVQINTFEPFVRFEEQQNNTEENAKSQSPVSTSSPATDAKTVINANGESNAGGNADASFRNYN